MDIESISRQSLGVSQLIRAQVGSGRISLPVKSNQIYANFKNITGVGGGARQPSFTINQLRSLDNLIERLKLLKGKNFQETIAGSSEDGLSEMIEKLNKELYNELHKNNPYTAGVSARGVSLDIFV